MALGETHLYYRYGKFNFLNYLKDDAPLWHKTPIFGVFNETY